MRFHIQIHKLLLILGGLMTVICVAGCREKDSFPQPASRQPVHAITIVALGDSLTEGYGVKEHQAYPALLEAMLLKEGFSGKVINAGISGETSSGLLSRISRVLLLKPDIVILCTGANDGLQGMDHGLIQNNISKIIRIFKEHRVTVVLAGMKMLVNYGPSYTVPYARLYAEIVDQEEILFIPFLLEGVARKPELNLADGIHPNARGYKIIASSVYPLVLKAIHQRQAQ
ncbi:MAG: arylesterase [Desulfatirhabdiaceae bacterium]|nr:arylesterase [Desulfatirhabdiaceae bacterium]